MEGKTHTHTKKAMITCCSSNREMRWVYPHFYQLRVFHLSFGSWAERSSLVYLLVRRSNTPVKVRETNQRLTSTSLSGLSRALHIYSSHFSWTCSWRLNKEQMICFKWSLDKVCKKLASPASAQTLMCLSSPTGLYCLLIRTNLISLLHSRDYWSGFHRETTSELLLFQPQDRTHPDVFPLSLMFYSCLCVAPQSSPRLVWSLLGSSRSSAHMHTHSWLIMIPLSAGGTAACWGRNVAWHLWKRSWGSKGWVPSKGRHTQIHLHPTSSDLSLFMQEGAPSVQGQIIAC